MSNHQHLHSADHADGLPARLPSHLPFLLGHMKRVIKYEHGNLKTKAVLSLVGSILTLVPGKLHGSLIVTNMYIH